MIVLAGPARAGAQLTTDRFDFAAASTVREKVLQAAVTTHGSSSAPAEPGGGNAGKAAAEPQLDLIAPAPLAPEADAGHFAGASLTAEGSLENEVASQPARSAGFYWLMLIVATLTLGSFAVASSQLSGQMTTATASWRGIAGWAGDHARLLWSGRGGAAPERIPATALANLRADLHDGPAQHLAYALMHLDEIEPREAPDNDPRHEAFKKVERSIRSALEETREIASGTSLPAIRRLDPASVIADAIRNHETRTHTNVHRQISDLPSALAPSVKVCLYRFTQEGLNNAYRHARGKGQKLTIKLAGNEIFAEVADDGPGSIDSEAKSDRLGLAGLRQRAEAAGGKLEVVSMPGKGTKLVLRLPAPKRAETE